ncbi:MAG: hypothetical protein E4G90_00115, partial [Gemmatimonadales bacterium]
MNCLRRSFLGGLTLAALLSTGAVAQQREYVLNQVQVPHHYYWREMYVPQVTSGPNAVGWSPDGTELVYSMQGSLWRQRMGTTEAIQLTAGPGYDHQPDWSPDGRWVVFTRYVNDALDLQLLDLTSGEVTTLLANGGVNLDARWSPDGRRLVFVSTAYEGRWHVFVAPFDSATGRLGNAVRITEDLDSRLPRYYYSTWDHYLSPTWGPGGEELILVSNRDRVWGTGGFWRMSADGGPMRELWYEETTWKARPDWAPDGRRVVYSGYHGRQRNQLWIMTADGGDPFQLTYGDFDATAPRWSPDGRHIAFISNEEGNTSLWVVDVPGGRRQQVFPRDRRYRTPVGRLRVSIESPDGAALGTRVSVFDETGKSWTPDDAWRHSDEAFVRGERQFEYGYFHSQGQALLTLPPGRYVVESWKGPEYSVGRTEVEILTDETAEVTITMGRLLDLPALGWWGGDLNVHMNYGGTYRNTPANLKRQAQAEGLHVVENLIVNKEQRIPDIAHFRVDPDPVSTGDFLLMHAEEFHTSFWGHTALLGLQEYMVLPNYVGYANTGAASLAPTNTDVFDLAHAQGGLTGYVHPFDSRPDPYDQSQPLHYAMPVDAVLGSLDYFEVMGYSDHLITSEIWYRLLNTGLRIPAGAGTDAFPNFASLRGPPGLVRVYARTDQALEHRSFLEAIRAGRTFVSNGPLLGLGFRAVGEDTTEWHGIGDEIELPAGAGQLQIQVTLRSNVPVDHLEVIRNGRVAVSIPLTGGEAVDTVVSLPVEESSWYVVRAYADHPREPILDLYPFASTSPLYVTVGGRPIRSREDAMY